MKKLKRARSIELCWLNLAAAIILHAGGGGFNGEGGAGIETGEGGDERRKATAKVEMTEN